LKCCFLAKASKLALFIFLLFVQLIFALPFRIGCSGESFVVPDDFSLIQEAIDHAEEGAIILVKKGVYHECIKITKSLKLVGECGAVIQSTGSWHTVEVAHDNVVIENFIVNGTGASPWSGIMIENQANVTLVNNTITHHYFGVHFYDSFNNKMHNNTMANNTYNLEVWGLFLSHFIHTIDSSNKVDGKPVYYWVRQKSRRVPSDAGYVGIVDSENILVKDLILVGNGEGVLLAYTKNSAIVNVNVSHNRNGFRLVSSNHNFIVGNKISKNEFYGLILAASSDNLVSANNFSGQKYGITLTYSPILNLSSNGNQIGGNDFHNHTYCSLSLYQVENNRIFANTFSDNSYAASISKSQNNTFYHNIFLQNSVINVDGKSQTFWNSTYLFGGNFWWDYMGVDGYNGPFQNETGSDGIGDTPYIIDENNKDHYPLMKPPDFELPAANFSWSPADAKVFDTIHFIDQSSSTGEILFKFWDFGFSFFIQRSEVTYTFDSPNVYPICLVVVNNDGRFATSVKNLTVRKILTTLTMFCNVSTISIGETVEISAFLKTEEEKPVSEVSITFYISNIPIGENTTDSNGSTKIFFKPNQTGTLKVSAVFLGTEICSPSETFLNITVIASSQLELWKIVGAAAIVLSLLCIALLLFYYKTWKGKRKDIPRTEKN